MRFAAEHKRLDMLLASVQRPPSRDHLTPEQCAALDEWRVIVDAMTLIAGPCETFRMMIEGDPALQWPLAGPVDHDAHAAAERYKDAIRGAR